MNLREAARGRPCQIRLSCCNHDPDTTVLAHLRAIELGSGAGHKPNDIFAAHACSACHDAIDRRTHTYVYSYEQVRDAHVWGVLRTLAALVAEGYQFERSRKEDAA